MPFKERGGMDREQTETDLTRSQQVFEEGDKFESSFLRLSDVVFWLSSGRHTHLLRTLPNDLRFGFAFQEENASCFKATVSPYDSEYQEHFFHAGRDVFQNDIALVHRARVITEWFKEHEDEVYPSSIALPIAGSQLHREFVGLFGEALKTVASASVKPT